MNIPTLITAEAMLAEAAQMNPGPWEDHSRHVARAASAIAELHPDMDAEAGMMGRNSS